MTCFSWNNRISSYSAAFYKATPLHLNFKMNKNGAAYIRDSTVICHTQKNWKCLYTLFYFLSNLNFMVGSLLDEKKILRKKQWVKNINKYQEGNIVLIVIPKKIHNWTLIKKYCTHFGIIINFNWFNYISVFLF